MRSLFAGVAVLVLVLVLAGACAMSAEAPSASMAMEAVKAPVAIESKFATSPDGTKIHYNASGSGPLVIAIHGFPDFSASWDKLAPVLNDKYRFVALDTRGYSPASRVRDISFGGVHAVFVRKDGRRIGVADPRRDGTAAGW